MLKPNPLTVKTKPNLRPLRKKLGLSSERSMKEEEKIDFLMRVIEADKGAEGEDMDF